MKKQKDSTTFKGFKGIFQIILIFILVGGIMATIMGAMLGISMIKIAETSPKVDAKNLLLSLDQNSKIYDKKGKLIESLAYDEYREIVTIDKIPEYLQKAFISIEDERFEKHRGVDPISIVRATLKNITSGGISQGGSTITQQLVKNVYLSDEVKFERKIREMYLALKIENQISKKKILEGYLNRVFLGQHAYGVEAASETYFNKKVDKLNLAQAATLASIVQAPSSYALFEVYQPANVPKDAKILGNYYIYGEKYVAVANPSVLTRKDNTLQKMYSLGYISKKQLEEAKKFDVMASVVPTSKLSINYSSQISSFIKKQALRIIMDTLKLNEEEASNILYTGGLSIYTTIDWDVQDKLEKAYSNFANLYQGSSGNNPILSNFNFDENDDILDDYGNKLFYKKSNILTNSNKVYLPKGWYEISSNGDLTINSSRFTINNNLILISPYYTVNDNNELVTYRIGAIELPEKYLKSTNDKSFTISSEFFKNNPDFYKIYSGNLVINDKYYNVENKGTVQPQSASVILDSRTAEIVAMVAKRGSSPDDTIDRATNFNRPPASSFKPLAVYAPAIEEGRTLATPVDDTPYTILDNQPWPQNVDETYSGIITTRKALTESLNPPAVKIFESIGIDKSKEYLERFGIINKDHPERDNFISKKEDLNNNDENISLALGGLTEGVTVLDMASAYQTFANNGERVESSIISSIKSPKHGEFFKNTHKPIKVISEQTNWLIGDVLYDVAHQDYLNININNDIWYAGKTGTHNDQRDFWFVGYNPYYTAATWIGFDNNGLRIQGNSSVASTFWGSYMSKILENKDPISVKRPAGIVAANVSRIDGLLPSKLTARDPRGNMIYTEYFREGTVPTKISEASVEVNVDKRNNKLAPKNAPSYIVEKKVFMQRPISYDPQEFLGIVPLDWKFRVPTEVSNLPLEETTETKKLEDGSVQTITTQLDGTVITKTTQPNGTIIIQTKKPNGKVYTEVIDSEKNKKEPKKTEKPN